MSNVLKFTCPKDYKSLLTEKRYNRTLTESSYYVCPMFSKISINIFPWSFTRLISLPSPIKFIVCLLTLLLLAVHTPTLFSPLFHVVCTFCHSVSPGYNSSPFTASRSHRSAWHVHHPGPIFCSCLLNKSILSKSFSKCACLSAFVTWHFNFRLLKCFCLKMVICFTAIPF